MFNFLMEVWVNSAWNTCWTYEPVMLRNSLMMVPWCQNMKELVS